MRQSILPTESCPEFTSGNDEQQDPDGKWYLGCVNPWETSKPSRHYANNNNIMHDLFSWYSLQMDRLPVLTKSLTGGCSAIIGDVFAQYIEYTCDLLQSSSDELVLHSSFNVRRAIAVYLTGLAYGPLLHYVYEFYEYVFPIENKKSLTSECQDSLESGSTVLQVGNLSSYQSSSNTTSDAELDECIQQRYACAMFFSIYTINQRKYINALLHVVIDQGIMGFVYVAIMMAITGVVEGEFCDLKDEFHNNYIDNVHALWIAALVGIGPMQLVVFRYVPLKWRCIAVNILDVFEVMVMSTITHRS